MATRTVIIEDHILFRELLRKICVEKFGVRVVGESGAAAEGLEVCRKAKPELLLLDINLPDGDGLVLAETLLDESPGIRILALSSECDDFTLHRVINSGVHGYVDKVNQPIEVLQEAIGIVMKGGGYFSSAVQRVRQSLHADPHAFTKVLTLREQELLVWIGAGLTNEEVGEKLQVSPQTVQGHRKVIMSKLGIHRTPDLIRYAVRKGFTKIKEFE